MNNSSTSLAEMSAKYQSAEVNLLLPMSHETRLNPFYKLDEMTVAVDTSANSGDIFKVGTQKEGNEWVEFFSPAKPLLMKISTAAGIQFDPNHTYGEN